MRTRRRAATSSTLFCVPARVHPRFEVPCAKTALLLSARLDPAKKRVELAMRKELIEATEAVERKPVVMPPLRAKFNPKELNEFIKSINPEAYEFEEVVKFACDYLARYFKLVVGRDLKVIEYEYEVFDEGYIIVQHLERSEA